MFRRTQYDFSRLRTKLYLRLHLGKETRHRSTLTLLKEKRTNADNRRIQGLLSQFIMNNLAPMNEEINLLRNFAQGVSQRLEKAERSAREQDNHHYYKIFADGVKTLLEAL